MRYFDNRHLQAERDCGPFELWLRRVYSGIFYHRLYRKRHPEHPHYMPKAITAISSYLANKQHPVVFEWGSGISTIWYAQRVKTLVSIEHHEGWFFKVTDWLEEKNLANVDLHYLPPDEAGEFQKYTQSILQYADNFFDLVAIDGRNRVECARQAASKVKIGGYLILDDSHRPRYQETFSILENYQNQRYDFGLLQTTIFKRVK